MLVRAARVTLFLLALTPLVVDQGALYPFITAKALFVRALVPLCAALVVIEMLRSSAFRVSVADRLIALGREPITLSIAAFLVSLILATVAAADTSRALLGDIERSEGFIGFVPLIGFFGLAMLLFDTRDWLRFFRVTLVVGIVLSGHAFWQWRQGHPRPGSLTGLAAFLGPYCLFVVAAAILVAAHAQTRRAQWLSLAAIPVAIATLLLTQTRAAILGLAVAAGVVLVLISLRGVRRHRRVALTVLACLVVAGSAFQMTRSAAIWREIPGVRRVAEWNAGDFTTQTRLGAWEASMAAMAPRESGWRRLWVGWGLENFHVPFNRQYDPRRFSYEIDWFDRSHNKVIDVLVTMGLVGLAAYLSVWVAFFSAAADRTRSLPTQAALMFAGVAYFMQNLVSLESYTTYVPFFGFLAFALPRPDAMAVPSSPAISSPSAWRKRQVAAVGLIGALAVLGAYSLAVHTIPAYAQVRAYVALYRGTFDTQSMLQQWERVRLPFTYAQLAIRPEFLTSTRTLVRRDRRAEPLLAAAIMSMEEVAQRDSLNARHPLALAEAMGEYADVTGRPDLHRGAERHLRRALALAPGRRHIQNALAINQQRQACPDHPSVCYYRILATMVAARNAEGTALVRERLELLDPPRRPVLTAMRDLVRDGKWHLIRLAVTGNDVRITLSPEAP